MSDPESELGPFCRDLERLGAHLRCVRHEPGLMEIRITLAGLAEAAMLSAPPEDLLKGLPGIRGAKFRMLSRTASLAYDPEIWPYAEMEKLLDAILRPGPAGRVRECVERMRGRTGASET